MAFVGYRSLFDLIHTAGYAARSAEGTRFARKVRSYAIELTEGGFTEFPIAKLKDPNAPLLMRDILALYETLMKRKVRVPPTQDHRWLWWLWLSDPPAKQAIIDTLYGQTQPFRWPTVLISPQTANSIIHYMVQA